MSRDQLMAVGSFVDGKEVFRDVPELVPAGKDGDENLVTVVNDEWIALWASVDSGAAETHTIGAPKKGGHTTLAVLDDSFLIERQHVADVSAAAEAIENAKKVVVTVDDGVMPATMREMKLQSITDEVAKASVKARVAKQEGVLPSQVLVETLAEHQARIVSE